MSKLDGYTLDEVLAWINAERKARSYGPALTEIPKGTAMMCTRCPVAQALNNSPVNSDEWYPNPNWHFLDGAEPLPECVRLFILDLDSGEYPELTT